ncbi:hypothetical protein BHE74_00027587 [Ensete ventricosum]|nr:hypothetical protein BHE74_00027587 [Ensete ventricosum]RZS03447.1 hypothetical protein BHM03_00033632 [Ensete ventricosum]
MSCPRAPLMLPLLVGGLHAAIASMGTVVAGGPGHGRPPLQATLAMYNYLSVVDAASPRFAESSLLCSSCNTPLGSQLLSVAVVE